jgi:hypothetical protein
MIKFDRCCGFPGGVRVHVVRLGNRKLKPNWNLSKNVSIALIWFYISDNGFAIPYAVHMKRAW